MPKRYRGIWLTGTIAYAVVMYAIGYYLFDYERVAPMTTRQILFMLSFLFGSAWVWVGLDWVFMRVTKQNDD